MTGWNSWDADSVWERRAAIKAQDQRFVRAARRAHPELYTGRESAPARRRKARDVLLVAPLPDPLYEQLLIGLPWQRIVAEVAKKHRVSITELLGARRGRPLVQARHEAMYRLKTETLLSLPAIGQKLRRDHTSVMHGVARHRARLEQP